MLVPAIASAAVDSDGDGLTDDFELRGLTDPQNPDSDRDGLNDGDEVKRYHTNPLVPKTKSAAPPATPPSQSPAPQAKDTDHDGRDDGTEVKNKTNPRIPLL